MRKYFYGFKNKKLSKLDEEIRNAKKDVDKQKELGQISENIQAQKVDDELNVFLLILIKIVTN